MSKSVQSNGVNLSVAAKHVANIEKFKLQITYVLIGCKLVFRTVQLEEIFFSLLRRSFLENFINIHHAVCSYTMELLRNNKPGTRTLLQANFRGTRSKWPLFVRLARNTDAKWFNLSASQGEKCEQNPLLFLQR